LIPIECESLLELDFVRLVEADPDITSIIHQPREIMWTLDGFTRVHIPDFAITYRGSPVIVEVKPHCKAIELKVCERTKIVTRDLAEEGILYRILTETFIRREPQLTLAKLVLRGLAHNPTHAERKAVLELLANHPSGLSATDIRSHFEKPGSFINSILAMVLSGDLVIAEHRNAHGALSTPSASEAVVRIRQGA
jgi:hypothetical protein